MTIPTPPQQLAPLQQRFLEQVLAGEPHSVLDVGCGAGALVAALASRGVRAVGLDPAAGNDGLGPRRVRALATCLPAARGAFHTVCLRHVPHHLEHPREALAEAWRVASAGLVLAEPWFDPSLPGQRAGLELDRWLKGLDRARGRFHGESLGPAELLALLPEAPGTTLVETFLPLRPWSASDVERRLRLAASNQPMDAQEATQAARWLGQAHAGQLTAGGTVILSLAKIGAS